MISCVRCFVSGKVQGVYFRGSTQERASELGLVGYAKNIADGRVEVLACGEPMQVKELKEWLWQGPVEAQVTNVQCAVIECGDQLHKRFFIG